MHEIVCIKSVETWASTSLSKLILSSSSSSSSESAIVWWKKLIFGRNITGCQFVTQTCHCAKIALQSFLSSCTLKRNGIFFVTVEWGSSGQVLVDLGHEILLFGIEVKSAPINLDLLRRAAWWWWVPSGSVATGGQGGQQGGPAGFCCTAGEGKAGE